MEGIFILTVILLVFGIPIAGFIMAIVALVKTEKLQNQLRVLWNENEMLRQKSGIQVNPTVQTPAVNPAQTVIPPQQAQMQHPIQSAPQVTAPQPAIPLQQSHPLYTAPAQTVSQPQYTQQPVIPRQKAERPQNVSGKAESFIGRIILSIAAALLIFIGLAYIAIDDKAGFPDWVRIGSMFTISALYLVTGLILDRKKRNNLTLALTGCGAGALFISILLTHVMFGYLSDLTAFGLLLIWTVFSLWLTKYTDSLLLSIITHIGMVFSICFGFALGLSDEKLILLLVYQFVSSAVLIVGNMLCYKRTYHVGLLVSLLLTSVAGGFLWAKFAPQLESDAFLFNSTLPVWLIALSFYLQFLAATYISYLLSVSSARIGNKTLAGIVQTANKLLWTASAGVNFCLTTYNLMIPVISGGRPYSATPLDSTVRWKAFLIEVIAALLILILHCLIGMLLRAKLDYPKMLSGISLIVCTVGFSILLIWFAAFSELRFPGIPSLLYLIIPAAVLFIMGRRTASRAVVGTGYGLLGFDALYMLFAGYFEISASIARIYPSLIYAVLLLAVLWIAVLTGKKRGTVLLDVMKMLTVVFVEFSVISIFVNIYFYQDDKFRELLTSDFGIALILTIFAILLYIFRLDRRKDMLDGRFYTPMRVFLLVNEALIVLICCLTVPGSGLILSSEAQSWILLAAVTALAFCRVGEVLGRHRDVFLNLFTFGKLTLIPVCFIINYKPITDSGYIISIVCMLTALIAVIYGFAVNAKSARLYGLILTLISVLKLAIFDISASTTMVRIISLIAGGLICFVISAVYTYTERKIAAKQTEITDNYLN